jgi:hypothetical protein
MKSYFYFENDISFLITEITGGEKTFSIFVLSEDAQTRSKHVVLNIE